MLLAFSLAIFLSAFLLFWVEPLFAKQLLPLLGGSPAVWNTCLMFFQAMLLAGYLYAHLTSRWLTPRRQAVLHAGLLAASFLLLPVAVPAGWDPPSSGTPVGWMVLVLAVGLGGPFLLLSATSPVLQRWLAATDHPRAEDPYVLYATSNVGSFGALLAFPFLLERWISLPAQVELWGWSYAAFAAMVLVCGVLLWRATKDAARGPAGATPAEGAMGSAPEAPTTERGVPGDGDDAWGEDPVSGRDAAPAGAVAGAGRAAGATSPVTPGDRIRWVVLAFIPSSLLLGVTTYLTTDVAAVPLLWVVPLAVYLLTFVLAFSGRRIVPDRGLSLLQAALAALVLVLLFWRVNARPGWAFPLHLAAFFATAWLLHRRLADLRPHPEHLTEFYLWLGVGGALGGVFNALMAPVLFDAVVEYRWMLLAACLFRPTDELELVGWKERLAAAALAVIPGALMGGMVAGGLLTDVSAESPRFWLAGGTAAALAFLTWRYRRLFTAALAGIAVVGTLSTGFGGQVLYRERSFFGAYQVTRAEPGPHHALYHGTTLHGAQYRDGERELRPTTYYHPDGPVGETFRALGTEGVERVAAVGLGTGSMACYAGPEDAWAFYEIDPTVVRIARDPELFSFLSRCPGPEEIVLGDARLRLEAVPAGAYDLVVLDAFSSDAIPVHLLTVEAMRIYRRVLEEDGVLLLHISNRYLDLEPVVAAVAGASGLEGYLGYDAPGSGEDAALARASNWVVLARSADLLAPVAAHPGWRPLRESELRPWTDDFSSIVPLMEWW